MSRYKFQNHARDLSGNIIPDAIVTIFNANSTGLATAYSSSGGSTAISGSVVSSNSTNGFFSFWVDTKDYNSDDKFKIQVSKTNFLPISYDDLVLFPQTEWIYYADAGASDQGVDANENSIADLLAEIGTSDERTIVLKPGTYTYSTNDTITSNITLRPQMGALISITNGITLTINGKIDAHERQQIFSMAGTTSKVTGLSYVTPEWFGAVADNSTDNLFPIHHAVAALIENGTIEFTDATNSYNYEDQLKFPTDLTDGVGKVADIVNGLSFIGRGNIQLKNTNATTGFITDGIRFGVTDASTAESGDNSKSSSGKWAIISERTDVTFANVGAADTITIPGIADLEAFGAGSNFGFSAGDTIRVQGSVSNDTNTPSGEVYTIASVVNTVITLSASDSLTDEAAGVRVSIQGNATYMTDITIKNIEFTTKRAGVTLRRVMGAKIENIKANNSVVAVGNDGADDCFDIDIDGTTLTADSTLDWYNVGYFRCFNGSIKNVHNHFNVGDGGVPPVVYVNASDGIMVDGVFATTTYAGTEGINFTKSRRSHAENFYLNIKGGKGIVSNFQGADTDIGNTFSNGTIVNADRALDMYARGTKFSDITAINITTVDIRSESGSAFNEIFNCRFSGAGVVDIGDSAKNNNFYLNTGLGDDYNDRIILQHRGASSIQRIFSDTFVATVTLTAAQMVALETTAIKLVDANGANTWLEFLGAMISYNYDTTAFTINADDDFVIRYEGGVGTDLSAAVETTGFIDQANDEIRFTPASAWTVADDIVSVVDKNIEIFNPGTGITAGGASTLIINVTYRTHFTGL